MSGGRSRGVPWKSFGANQPDFELPARTAGLASIDGHAWITTAIDPQALDELLFSLAGRNRKLAFA